MILFFVGGFFVGSLWTDNQILRAGGGKQAQVADTGQAQPPEPKLNLDQTPPVTDKDHIRGSRNAKVVLIEYSDFECPFCSRFHPTTQQLLKDYGDEIALVYRHFPLTGLHPNAQAAAEASECVNKLGGNQAFWAYADAIFDINQKSGRLSPEGITQAAQAAKVDMTQFKSCLDKGEFKDKVNQESSNGAKVGFSGTPATIVVTKDGAKELISGAVSLDQAKAVIDNYLQ